MNSEQHEVQLGDYVELLTGFPFKSAAYVDAADAVRLLRGDNIGQGRLRWEDAKRWPLDKCSDLDGFKLREGDVVLAMDRPWIPAGLKFAKVRRDDIPAFLVQRVARLRPRTGIATNFLHYVIASSAFTQHIQNVTTGTAVPHISAKQIREYRFELPDLSTQEACGDVLMALDDRIALLRETNATLEAIAQALFKSWFVDFDPVRAKQQGIAPAGMDEATAALFPDSLAESVLGLVPQSWRLGALDDLADLNSRSWSGRNHPERVRYLDLANVKDNEIVAVTDFAFDDAPSRARRALRNGDTIVGTVRPGNRSFAFIHEPEPHLTASTGFAVLSPRAVDNVAFVYLAATQDASIEHLAHVADGGAYPAVRPDVVSALACVVPSAAVLHAFNAAACRLLEKVSANQCQAQTLATLRDTLLPRLISGQLRLPEAQAQIEVEG